VADLILQNPRDRNEPLISKMFLFHEAEEILNLRIPVSEGDDILAWHYEKSGIFSVRSAYKLALEGRSKNNCGTSMSADRKIYDAIWKTPVPQKVKNFIWKLAHNDLGVQSNRLRHHLIYDATYPICGMEPEDGHHAMVRCTFALALRLDMLYVSHGTSLKIQPSLIQDPIGFLLFLIAPTKTSELN